MANRKRNQKRLLPTTSILQKTSVLIVSWILLVKVPPFFRTTLLLLHSPTISTFLTPNNLFSRKHELNDGIIRGCMDNDDYDRSLCFFTINKISKPGKILWSLSSQSVAALRWQMVRSRAKDRFLYVSNHLNLFIEVASIGFN